MKLLAGAIVLAAAMVSGGMIYAAPPRFEVITSVHAFDGRDTMTSFYEVDHRTGHIQVCLLDSELDGNYRCARP